MAERIFRWNALTTYTGLSKTKIWEEVQAGRLDPPIPLGERAVGFLESSVDKWQQARIAERDAETDAAAQPTTPKAKRHAATRNMREARARAIAGDKVGA